MDLDYILISKATKHMKPPEGYRWISSTEVRKDGDIYCAFGGVWMYTDLVGDVPHNFKYARKITRDDMTLTPKRRLEIEQAANMYGSANCWAGTTGTLAMMIRELIDGSGNTKFTWIENADRSTMKGDHDN